VGHPVDVLIGSFEGLLQQWSNGGSWRGLVQIPPQSVDGQLRRQGTAFMPPHSVGYDLKTPQPYLRAAHTVLVFIADRPRFG
jgi:hypothetical protein